ncbi:hypothetical protein D3C85_1770650 [compost metagenome]
MIRTQWKMSFENRAARDGFGERFETRRAEQHPNRMVREFLGSLSDASHLFFAIHVMPQLESIDFKIDHHIKSLVRSLRKDNDGDAE